jgi:membrane protein implicated in regulation of membrane protease activity
MTKKAYLMFNIATGLPTGAVLAAIFLWLLPLWGINIPIWGIILLIVVFVIYEIITFRLGWRALKRKPSISLKAIVGCCGKATTPLTPKGYVQVQGELWQALCSDRDIDEGDDIVVLEVNRLTLRVAPLSGIVMTTSDMADTKLN